ncbi:hypothetical protein [Azohydromonas australica]|uniref:hypothetical protein n=1 Tax=Azohydromonas australica TaxID=364039 RepID=UPI0012EB8A8D|nr:hypothetical protein [Azohydromonas australica]
MNAQRARGQAGWIRPVRAPPPAARLMDLKMASQQRSKVATPVTGKESPDENLA